jgi:CelD/BcsL family acetyltransferase involved in cellulose biosynthesis
MQVEVRRFEDALPEEIWAGLAELLPAEQRFLSYQWFPSWSRTQLPRNRWRGPADYYVAFDADQPIGVVPFAYQKFGPTRLPALGGFYFPFRALLFAQGREKEIAAALASSMRSRRWLALRLGPLSRSHIPTQAMADALRAEGWSMMVQQRGVEYVVDLPSSVERFRAEFMSANLRSSIGRKHRRMMREGGVRLERYTGLAKDGWKQVLDDMATVERSSWVGKANGFLHFLDSRNAAFWRECLDANEMSAATQACILYFDGRPGAFEFWFDCGSCRYFVAGLHDERVSQYSPGYYLMQLMLEDAIQHGLSRVSLGQGDAGYKARFGATAGGCIDDW